MLNLANARVEGMGLQRTTAGTLDLANVRVEWVGLPVRRAMAGTLIFAKPSTCVLDLANTRVEWVGL